MSASKPRIVNRNPAKKFIRWKGAEKQGWFEYYDKEIEDPKLRNVKVELSEFAIVDEDLFSITGYVDETKSSIISNEVRSIEDKLIVKEYKDKKSKVVLEGTYAQLKETVRASKVFKYTKCIYILYKGELCHLSLIGSAFKSWIDTVSSVSTNGICYIHQAETKTGKKGIVEWKYPTFKVGAKIPKAEWDKIVEIDSEILQPYLTEYFNKQSATKTEESSAQQVDTTKWREFDLPSGDKLGSLNYEQIQDMDIEMVDAGDTDCPLYQCIGQAIYDYQQLEKTWDQKKDASGKPLTDYTYEELTALYFKMPPTHPSRQLIEVASEARKPAEEDDEIPF